MIDKDKISEIFDICDVFLKEFLAECSKMPSMCQNAMDATSGNAPSAASGRSVREAQTGWIAKLKFRDFSSVQLHSSY